MLQHRKVRLTRASIDRSYKDDTTSDILLHETEHDIFEPISHNVLQPRPNTNNNSNWLNLASAGMFITPSIRNHALAANNYSSYLLLPFPFY